MILDLPFNVTVDLGTVILGALFYAVGLVTVMALRRFKEDTRRDSSGRDDNDSNNNSPVRYHADDAVVEAIVLEYTRRLRDYDRVIAEMRTKLDIIEVKAQAFASPSPSQLLSSSQQQVQPHAQPVSEPVTVTQRPPSITATATTTTTGVDGSSGQNNGTVDYILKLLADRPRTSREVQHAIGRTREHTARLMKKLHEGGLVSRDANSKPFRYNITEAGRTRLVREEKQLHVSQAPEIRQ
ncbi:MAG TPA: helix-turn-helix domain-containing protein [Nitrososphaera sp.]|nr:helix-turn-helix domain-containing protein [Nitrososphaera sp.]